MPKRSDPRPVADLAPDPRNPRRIADEAAAGLGESMRRFGDIALIVWNRETGHLVAGHQRMAQLRAAGATEWTLDGDRGYIEHPQTHERFSVRVVEWSETEERAANLAANNPAIGGEFTADAIAQLEEIAAAGVDLGPLRLDALMDELRTEFPPEPETGQTDPDAVPEPPAAPCARTGDLWLLGNHRLLCGDATKPEDVARVTAGREIAAVVTDPPYGMSLDTDWSGIRWTGRSIGLKKNIRGKAYAPVVGDDKPFDPAPLLSLWCGRAKEVFLFGADYYAERIPARTEGAWLVWDKRKESQADGFGSEFELIWSRQKHKRRILRHEWFGFLRAGEHGEKRTHPTQKPVALIADILDQWCTDEIVGDPYAGSGTIFLAAERQQKIALALEIVPAYCDVIVLRWQTLTGKAATLDGDGRTFVEVAAERAGSAHA